MLTFQAPVALNGRLLEQQLAAAGLATPVRLNDAVVELADLDEFDRAAAKLVVDAHGPTAQAAAAAATSEQTNETTIRTQAASALANNRTFLAIASPTNAQVVAQVKALTRQSNALIRLALNRFDGTD